ncbi:hypothetical protein H0H93_008712 [Arthromyces matolae]|nr:hypothetical protein H0H93_008712 [Arthromyces matolae]
MTLSHHKAIAATSYALVSAAGILTFIFLSLYRLPAHFRLINSREDAQTVTSDFMASGGTGGATRTIGGSTIQHGGTSGLEFKPKSAIVIDVTQTQHSEVNHDKMAFMGDAHSTNSEGVLENKNAALYH